jgi:hypothetical protein
LGAAALVLDPERLLWVPGQRTIFLPSANTLITPELVTQFSIGQIVAAEWERVIMASRPNRLFASRAFFEAAA